MPVEISADDVCMTMLSDELFDELREMPDGLPVIFKHGKIAYTIDKVSLSRDGKRVVLEA
jgi:hypothetical protein